MSSHYLLIAFYWINLQTIKLLMIGQQGGRNSQNFKQILISKKKKKYDEREMLSLSILSLLPEKNDKESNIKNGLKNKLLMQKPSSKKIQTLNASSGRSVFVNAFLYKKSNEKQKKIFNKLKINNECCIRKISHIIFKAQIDEIINRIEKKAMLQMKSEKKSDSFNRRSSFKLSDACRVSHLSVNKQNRYARWQNFCTSISYRSKSTSIQRQNLKSRLLRTVSPSKCKNFKLNINKKQELRGWQQTPRRFLTHYDEDNAFDSLF